MEPDNQPTEWHAKAAAFYGRDRTAIETLGAIGFIFIVVALLLISPVGWFVRRARRGK